jgi:hypothetical protein
MKLQRTVLAEDPAPYGETVNQLCRVGADWRVRLCPRFTRGTGTMITSANPYSRVAIFVTKAELLP